MLKSNAFTHAMHIQPPRSKGLDYTRQQGVDRSYNSRAKSLIYGGEDPAVAAEQHKGKRGEQGECAVMAAREEVEGGKGRQQPFTHTHTAPSPLSQQPPRPMWLPDPAWCCPPLWHQAVGA